MKRIVSILLIAMLLLACTSCGMDSSEEFAVLTYRLEQAEEQLAQMEERLSALEKSSVTPEAQETKPEQENANLDDTTENDQFVGGDVDSILANALKEYANSKEYIKVAHDPENIHVQYAAELVIGKVEGYPVRVLLASVDADRDVYGVDVGHILVDMDDLQMYHWNSLDCANFAWENISNHQDALTAVLCCYSSWRYFGGSESYIVSEMEYRTEFTQEQLDQLNQWLNAR